MDRIAELLEGRLRDPETGEALSVPVRRVAIAPSLDGDEAALVKSLDLPRPYAVVTDQNTYEALGRRVEEALEPVIAIRLPGRPHPNERTAAKVMSAGMRAGSYIAVGSGTINDLVKFAAARQGKRCAVFPTAPSMNGYTSVNVAITVNGHKKSLAAVAPEGVFADIGVLARAPQRLIRAGFGDAICRSTAQADWYLAHRLLGQPYRRLPFDLFNDLEAAMVAEAGALARADGAAIERLMRVLLLSGFGMTLCGGSYPASQGEHLISHYIEMMHAPGWDEPLHGEQIAVTTLVMARLQEGMLGEAPPLVRASRLTKAALADHFGPALGAECHCEICPKLCSRQQAEECSARLVEIWPALREELRGIMRPASEIEDALQRAGAPVGYRDLNLSREFFANAVWHARAIRNRYTFLDLAADSGRLAPESIIGR